MAGPVDLSGSARVDEKKLKTLSLDLIDTICEMHKNKVSSDADFKAALTVILLPTLAAIRGEGVEIGYSTAVRDYRNVYTGLEAELSPEERDWTEVEQRIYALMEDYGIRNVR